MWVVVAVLAFAAWLSVLLFFLGLCRAAARGDQLVVTPAPSSASPARSADDGAVIDLCAFRNRRSALPRVRSAPATRPAASA